ncbi:MAG TPA: hydrogenase maturation nickel metallochaperone HypA [Brevefilum fermentans]|jgi:hydrogenase nickel incorporation protein HypA/HybF|nr:hydrogenase maturation nickel metallochaperone HypA [Brevefilum fermentans]
MHELSVTESVLEIACRHAGKAQAKRVTDIYLVIGRLSSIVDDSVQFYWNLISKDTLCENAQLHFRRVPAELVYLDCQHQYQLAEELTPCPKCNSTRIRVLSGDEFHLESIEIERK